jgi:hypothetical protein
MSSAGATTASGGDGVIHKVKVRGERFVSWHTLRSSAGAGRLRSSSPDALDVSGRES